MKKKIVFISIIIALVIVASIYVYNTYATDPVPSNDSYAITLTGNTSVTVPAMAMKKIIYQIKNTNRGTVSYAVGYSSQSNDVSVKAYYNSADTASGTVTANGYKNVTLAVINNSSASATINLSTILGYENGGNLIIPSGTTQVTEVVYNAASYITNLYTNATKSTATVNSITYNLASSVGLMDDRLGSSSTPANTVGNIRYYGANPYNYVWLGDTYTEAVTFPGNTKTGIPDITRSVGDKKLWRIVGVFNGKLKLVSNDLINTQTLSWDTSANTVNSGLGVNQWGESTYSDTGDPYSGADLMKLLNPGYEDNQDLDKNGNTVTVNNSLYWNKGTGTVYTGRSNATTANVSFANTGLTANERNMIDTVSWYTGAYDQNQFSYADAHYTAERGSLSGKASCTQGTSGCNDDITRTSSWNGKVGLIYPSDYGYAADLSQCNQTIINYNQSGCYDTAWLYNGSWYWTLSPRDYEASGVFVASAHGYLGGTDALGGFRARSAVYLKPNVIIDTNSNDGSEDYPYQLLLN